MQAYRRCAQVRALFAEAIDGGNDSIMNVRVVRDKATNRGKGIAYVGFKVRYDCWSDGKLLVLP